jgi:hypothetical protein
MVLPRAVLYRPLTAKIQAGKDWCPPDRIVDPRPQPIRPVHRAQIDEGRLANVVYLLATASQARQLSTVQPLS